MRKLIDVIDEILVVVPKSRKDIIESLIDIQDSQQYRAPEDMLGWYCVKEILDGFEYNNKTPKWQLKMLSIFTTTPLDVIEEKIKNING